MFAHVTDTAAIFVDMQERMMPIIHENESVTNKCRILLRGLQELNVPVIFTRHYPKGLGDTVSRLREAADTYTPYDKITFSVLGDTESKAAIKSLGRRNIIVCGVEAHICVLQTVIDLIAEGYNVYLAADCISSRDPYNKKIALRRAVQEKATLTTLESILFELMERAGTDTFKAVQKLIK